MKSIGALLLFVFSLPSWGVECLYQNNLHGLTPTEYLSLVESGKKPAHAVITLKTWFNTSQANQKALSSHIRILSTDCSQTAIYPGDDGEFFPVATGKIQVPFGDLYYMYAAAAQDKNTKKISWLYKYAEVKPKSLGAYLKLWRLAPPAEAGGLETQKILIQLFKRSADYRPKAQDIHDETARNWGYTGTLDDFNFAKLFKSMGGVVLPDCGPYELPPQYEVVSAVTNKRPYQSAIDLMAQMQGYKVVPIEGHANLVKIPLGSNVPISVDFASCVEM
jgi:hypothetical protein